MIPFDSHPFRLLPVIARSRNDKIEKALFWVFAGRLPIHDIYTGRERGVLHFDRGRVGKHWALDFDFRRYSRARRWTEGEGGVVFFPRGEAETGASVDLSSFPYKRKCARSKIGKISVANWTNFSSVSLGPRLCIRRRLEEDRVPSKGKRKEERN